MDHKIIERLTFQNPWWQTNQIPTSLTPAYHRPVFVKIIDYLKLDRIIVLKGPRRTGKSTLLFQVMQSLISNDHVTPSRLCYISFDDPQLRIDLLDILANYESFNHRSLADPVTTYLFLDEIHALPHWSSLLKLLYDKKLNLKIIVSDSAASLLTHQSESLGGRTIEETILPLSFPEWIDYHQVKPNPGLTPPMQALFTQYLHHSGFMHLQEISDPTLRTRMLLEDVVTKAIYKDSVEIFGLREPAILEKIFSYLASASSGLVNVSKLASMLGIDRTQTSKYISFLKNTYLVFSLSKYSPLIRESLRSQPKIHLIDQGFAPIFATPADNIYESVVARHLFALYPRQLYFWRDRTEVDLVLKFPDNLVPIEVKNTNNISLNDLTGLSTFISKYNCSHAYILYNGPAHTDILGNTTLHFLPTWDFLLDHDKDQFVKIDDPQAVVKW